MPRPPPSSNVTPAQTPPSAVAPGAGPVLFFDGECGLCQRVVRLLLRLDRTRRLRFGPLQGPAAQAFLRVRGLPTADFDTLIFVPDWAARQEKDFLVRTDGVIAALHVCGGLSAMVGAVLGAVPRGARDAAYRFVARTRHRWFGPWRARPLAQAKWSARFLDGPE